MTDEHAPEPDGRLDDRIHNSDWDTLIVLDACRFDFFERFYRDIPNLQDGTLDRLYSPGRATPETLTNVFDGEYDWTMYSGHPWINSLENEIPAEKTQDGVGSYYAGDHFDRIHNIWRKWDHFDDERRTVSEYVLTRRKALNSERSIVWYLDPHMPYNGSVSLDLPGNWELPTDALTDADGAVLPGVKALVRTAYKSCLIQTLYYVAVVAGACEGKVVVTSDHGEQLFYGGDTFDWLGHRTKNDTHHLRHVPWLELDAVELTNLAWTSDEDYIDALYQAVLKRPVGENGLDWYSDALAPDGDLNRPKLLEVLMHSPEYEDEVGDPNALGAGKTISYEPPETDTMQQLRDLGYR